MPSFAQTFDDVAGFAWGHARGAFAAGDTAARVARLRRLAWLLDAALRLPGTRFRLGVNGVVGLAPGVGDALMGLLSLLIVIEAYRLGVPGRKLGQMLANIAVEVTAGAVPVVGDLFDMAFKANLRNVAILERHFRVGTAAR